MRVRHHFAGWLLVICAIAPGLAAELPKGQLTQHGTPEPPLPGGMPIKPAPLKGPAVLPDCLPGVCPPPPAPVADCPVDPPTPVVTIKVRADACTVPNKEITYRIKIENASAAFAHHVLVRNPLPANARFVRGSPEPHQTNPEIQWKINTLAPGGCVDFILVLAPTNTDDVRNCTRVTFEHGQCVTTRQAGAAPAPGGVKPPIVEEKPGVKPPGGEPIPPPGAGPAQLKLEMNGPKEQFANLPAKYFVTVRNTGGVAATKVNVAIILPAGADLLTNSPGGKFVAQVVSWNLERLDAGASRSVEVSIKAKKAGSLCVQAITLADDGLQDRVEVCTTFAGQSALTMDTVDTKDPVEVGQKTSYVIRITNQGQVTITNLKLRVLVPEQMELVGAGGPSDPQKDAPPKGMPFEFQPLKELEPGATATYEVTVRALRIGDVRFRVELRADQLDSGRPVFEEESTLLFADPLAAK